MPAAVRHARPRAVRRMRPRPALRDQQPDQETLRRLLRRGQAEGAMRGLRQDDTRQYTGTYGLQHVPQEGDRPGTRTVRRVRPRPVLCDLQQDPEAVRGLLRGGKPEAALRGVRCAGRRERHARARPGDLQQMSEEGHAEARAVRPVRPGPVLDDQQQDPQALRGLLPRGQAHGAMRRLRRADNRRSVCADGARPGLRRLPGEGPPADGRCPAGAGAVRRVRPRPVLLGQQQDP